MKKLYLITLLTLLAIDSIWLGLVSGNLYKKNLSVLISSKTNLFAGLLFYLIYAFALTYLVIIPSLKEKKINNALIKAGVLGIAAYSTFDLSGEAVFKNWPTFISLIDISWGAIVTILTTFVSINIYKKLNKS